jgi:hypothetical protein
MLTEQDVKLWMEDAIKAACASGIIVDRREEMPKGPGSWRRRFPEDIVGMCLHQNGSTNTDNPKATAEYHTGPDNHIIAGGCPSICYPIAIPDLPGPAWLVADLLDETAAQGSKEHPGYENKALIAVLMMGLYTGSGVRGEDEPSAHQMQNLEVVTSWLQHIFNFGPEGMFTHSMLSKPACPGYWGEFWIESKKAGNQKCLPSPFSWQKALLKWNPKCLPKHGPDGAWGAECKRAVLAFQKAHRLEATAMPDDFTELRLMREVKWSDEDEEQDILAAREIWQKSNV